MRRNILTLCLLFACIFTMHAEKYKIVSLNTPQIVIGGKIYHKGDTFEDGSNIKWESNRQSMEVKNLSTGKFYRLSRKLFESKKVSSLVDYFISTQRASTRGDSKTPLFTKSPTGDKFPEKRIALVIGNSDYSNLSYLRNAQKDASDVADCLLDLGFDVVEAYECTYADMRTALNNFSAKAADYDIAIFYFAGHGLQEEGQNYLIPVECPLEMRSQLRECLNADDIVHKLGTSGANERLIILDACRNTKKSWARSADEGLARMEGSEGTVIVFSTQSGKVALDGEGDNSPFAYSLLKNITLPRIGFSETMTGVVRDTYTLTGNQQYPLQVGTFISDFKFNSPGAKITAQSTSEPPKVERTNYGSANKNTPKPDVASQPRVKSDSPEMEVYVENCRMSGGYLIVDILLVNKSSKDRELRILDIDGDNQTIIYDNKGNRYEKDKKLEVRFSGRWVGDFIAPVNTPVKLQLRVPEAAETNGISRIDLALRGLPTDTYYGKGSIKIYDIPVGFKASKPVIESPMAVSINVPDIDIDVSDVKRVGDFIDFSMTLRNNTGKDLTPLILENDPGKSKTMYFDESGNSHESSDFSFRCGNSSGNVPFRFNLPDGIPTRITVRLKNVKQSSVIPRINIALRGISDAIYGSGMISISSLPSN